jgi:transposase
VLVELGVVEQRYRAVLEVLEDGAPVTEVARRYGVARQTVHEWLARYAAGGLGGPADRSSRPASCPHQMPAQVEARIAGLRRDHPGWGPSRILWELERAGTGPQPGRPAVYRALIRHGLVDPKKRKRRREDYRRWERGRAMHLWQMDVMGRVHLAGGQEVKIVTGIDDHSRFIVCAKAAAAATARPVCLALAEALRRHGIPREILTDNGKVFTGPVRERAGPGDVRPDLRGQRDPAPADRPVLADHDREGRAAAQDDAGGVLHPPQTARGRPSRSCRRRWTAGCTSTTPPGRTSPAAAGPPPGGSPSPTGPSPPTTPPQRRQQRPCQPQLRPGARRGCRGG